MHKKHLLPGFDDRIQEERDIERVTDEITQVNERELFYHPLFLQKKGAFTYRTILGYSFLAISCLSKEDQADQFRE